MLFQYNLHCRKNLDLLLLFIIVISYSLLLNSCASIKPPGGGPVDTTSPTLLNTIPKNGSVNFKSNKIILRFDERVMVKNLTKNLIVSPPLKKLPKYKVKKNIVKLTIQDTLEDTTTYTFNFRESVKDVTEENVPKNLKLTFSTGSYIDSSSIYGNVKDFFTKNPVNNATIYLYNEPIELITDSTLPYYISKSAENGNFSFDNIKEKNYSLIAFTDPENDNKYNCTKDNYRYIKINADTNYYRKIELLKQDTTTGKVKKVKQKGYMINVDFNKYITDIISLQPDTVPTFLEESQLKLFYQAKDTLSDTIQILITFKDSLDLKHNDTIRFKLKEDSTVNSLSIELNETVINRKSLNDYSLKSTIPIKSINYDSIDIKFDKNIVPANAENFVYNPKTNTYRIVYNKKVYDTTNIVINDTAFVSIYDQLNNKIDIVKNFRPDPDKSIISGDTKFENNILLELIDNQGNVKFSVLHPKEFNFYNIDAGKYIIRVIEDINNNEKWDINKKGFEINPEPITVYSDTINIKENWEINDLLITPK